MIKLKSEEEIKIMKEAGSKLKKVVQELLPIVKVDITTNYIDKKAEELIIKTGGEPSFKKVKNYRWSTCLPINDQAVHTPPSKRKLKNGDLLTIDIGLFYKGFHTDYATSFVVGKSSTLGVERFLVVGKETLSKALKKVRVGTYLGEISETIQKNVEKNGYHILKELTGHGIGKDLHEDPVVLQFIDRQVTKTYKMQEGLVIAVEVIYSMGTEQIKFEKGSDWSIVTTDGSLAACFEHTIAITHNGPVLIT